MQQNRPLPLARGLTKFLKHGEAGSVDPQRFKTLLLALSEEPATEDVAKKMKEFYNDECSE
ncbi:hypothetical protein GBAR_LOCUS18483, partial [Geodia barretti]